MSGGEIEFLTEEQVNNDPEMTAEGHQKWLDKEKEEKEFEAKFQEMRKERSTRAKKKVEKEVLITILKGAFLAIEAQVEKQSDILSCPLSLQLFRDPVFCIGDGITYEKEMIEEWFKNKNKSPKTGVELKPEQKVCVPNFAIRTACDAIRKEKVPENRSSEIPFVSPDEIINQLNDKIRELKDELEEMESNEEEYEEGRRDQRDEVISDLRKFWKAFADFYDARGSVSVIYEQLRLFREDSGLGYNSRNSRNFSMVNIKDWVMRDMEPSRICMNSGQKFPIPMFDGPVGVSETFRRTGVNRRETWIWDLWFETREARDAFHAQLPSDHPIITGDTGPSFRGMMYHTVPPTRFEHYPNYDAPDSTPDISRIRLEDLGGRQ